MSRTTTLGPFGEVIRATGPMAKANPIRFSTKYDDDESDLLYYGYRYYKPPTGTWLSRDQTGEESGLSLNAFVYNNAVNYIDLFGNTGAPATPSTDGTLTISVAKKAQALGDCGGAIYVVRWHVSGSSDGYVIQHIKERVNVTDCKGHAVASQNSPAEFTEAWQFLASPGLLHSHWPMGNRDFFQTKSQGSDRMGTIFVVGKVKFIKNYSLTVPPWGYHLPGTDAGLLPVIKPTPSGWTDAGALIHAMYISFCCCQFSSHESIVTTP